ncbi:3-dehydroquinate synthase [uncultured Roseobacter sp.]|uniref:3-dehydroquinate synthase n=1 Tax=uncultured Roseobacter sp. TaxID=114847 RepID=UPI002635DB57|nr:3-dehydroquinate synthase [uncultured Roseobacter sp.]
MGLELETIGDGSDLVWQRFEVPYEFPVVFCDNVLDPTSTTLLDAMSYREPDSCHKCLLFVDAGLLENGSSDLLDQIATFCAAHPNRIDMVAHPIAVPSGEAIKTGPEHLEKIQNDIHKYRIDRHSYVIAIGGGAVLDAVGYASAIAHRGVRHIRLPTTVLAQNDSGVGVKNAINLHGVKNYSGTFAPPWAVINDYQFIRSLPTRDRIAGLAEAVKVAMIRDGAFFDWMETHTGDLTRFEESAERYVIRRCAELHMRQIGQGGDPFERGSARPLDFGHWAAHKLESITRNTLRHGEAVAIGIALDTRYSVLTGLLDADQADRVMTLLEGLGFSLYHPDLFAEGPDGRSRLIAGLEEFREHLGGELTITLISRLGIDVEVHEIDDALMLQALHWLKDSFGPLPHAAE